MYDYATEADDPQERVRLLKEDAQCGYEPAEEALSGEGAR